MGYNFVMIHEMVLSRELRKIGEMLSKKIPRQFCQGIFLIHNQLLYFFKFPLSSSEIPKGGQCHY